MIQLRGTRFTSDKPSFKNHWARPPFRLPSSEGISFSPKEDGTSFKPRLRISSPKEGIAATAKKKLSECRVLVVDDDPSSVELFPLYLVKSVKSVDISGTASDALSKISKAAKNGKYDFVLCDIRLGGAKSGIDVEKEAIELSPGTRFVFISALTWDSFPKGKPALQKPTSRIDVLSLLNKLSGS